MNRSTLTLTLLLPALCAASSSAQVTPIRFVAPISPIAGLPRLLPSPISGPLSGLGISLPALTPSLVPSIAIVSAPQAAAAPAYIAQISFPAQPAALPGRAGQLPMESSRDGVVNPMRRVAPGMQISFAGSVAASANQSQPVPAETGADKQKLDETFDGDVAPAKPTVVLFPSNRRKPVASGRRIGLPEDELLRELGF
jgi:hypothetical protein